MKKTIHKIGKRYAFTNGNMEISDGLGGDVEKFDVSGLPEITQKDPSKWKRYATRNRKIVVE